ncbi:MAG: hypothetical protein ACO3PB_08365 [Miltoncostaeaceae bacterium]
MTPISASEWSLLLALLLLFVTLLWMLPACGDEECARAHTRHTVAQRAASIERTHATYHSPDRPQPLCSLCQSRKRDE